MTTTRPVKSRPARARVGGSRCDGARRKIPSASSAGLPRDRVFDVPPESLYSHNGNEGQDESAMIVFERQLFQIVFRFFYSFTNTFHL